MTMSKSRFELDVNPLTMSESEQTCQNCYWICNPLTMSKSKFELDVNPRTMPESEFHSDIAIGFVTH